LLRGFLLHLNPIFFMKFRKIYYLLFAVLLITAYLACNRSKEPEQTSEKTQPAQAAIPPMPIPGFDSGRAFADILTQVAFGTREPNSNAHAKEVDFIDKQLLECTPNVELQTFTSPGYKPGETLNLTNVIASFNPSATYRILILTHFDSRPWADEDPDTANRNKPIPAANDGASGTAVMLEMARQMKDHPPPIGVDLFFDDGEDYGKDNVDGLDRYFLGVKYFVNTKPANFNPQFAILLDMVGDKKAVFEPEGNSIQSAPAYVKEVWGTASSLGLSHFKPIQGPTIEDDHLPLIQSGIPSVDIIDGELVGYMGSDPDRKYWHTLDDLPKHLSPETLGEVGHLLLTLIYDRLPRDIPSL
jgi:glutaminyl-peptide cyclotransferase